VIHASLITLIKRLVTSCFYHLFTSNTTFSTFPVFPTYGDPTKERASRRTIKLNSSIPREFHDESNRYSRFSLEIKIKKKRESERMSKGLAVLQRGHWGPINPPPPVRFRVKGMESFIGLSGYPHPRDLESNCR